MAATLIPLGTGLARHHLDHPGLGHDQIERRVGVFQRDVVPLLPRESKANGQRGPPRTQHRQRTVIKAAAIAQPPARAVEGQKRHDHDLRLEKSGSAGIIAPRCPAPSLSRGPTGKGQRVVRLFDHWHADGTMGASLGHGGARINLRSDRHETRQRHAAVARQNLGKIPCLRRIRLFEQGLTAGKGRLARLGLPGGAIAHNSTKAARPRKAKKPTTSVTVVTNAPEASAGSTPNRSSKIGMPVPASPATTRLITIAVAMT